MKNLVKVAISGIALGIAFLMVGYIGIYYVLGEAMFVQEIARASTNKNFRKPIDNNRYIWINTST